MRGKIFLNFCLSEKVFISPSPLKDNFTGYRILGWWGFSLNISVFYSTLFFAYIISKEKSDIILIFVSLQVRFFFPPSLFKDFFLAFDFLKLEYNMPKYKVLFCFSFILFGIHWTSSIIHLVSDMNWANSLSLVLKTLFLFLISFFSF